MADIEIELAPGGGNASVIRFIHFAVGITSVLVGMHRLISKFTIVEPG